MRWVIPAQFSEAKSFSEGLAAVRIGGKWGFINKQGDVAISAEYDDAGSFFEGMAKVGNRFGKDLRYGFIDKTGNIAIPVQFYAAESFSEGLASVILIDGKDGPVKRPTYIDKTGNVVLQLQFSGKGNHFTGGLALIESFEDKKYHNEKIDRSGKVVHWIAPLSEGYVMGIINKSGKVLHWIGNPGPGNVILSEGMMTYNMAEGYVDAKTGYLMIPFGTEFRLRHEYCFSGGLAPVKRDGKWGYVDKEGRTLIPFQFDSASSFSDDGLAYVVFNNEVGFIDKTGQILVKPKIDLHWYGGTSPNIFEFNFVDDLVRVSSFEKDGYYFGYFDKTGELAIPIQFADAADFSEGLAAVKLKGGKWGYIGKP